MFWRKPKPVAIPMSLIYAFADRAYAQEPGFEVFAFIDLKTGEFVDQEATMITQNKPGEVHMSMARQLQFMLLDDPERYLFIHSHPTHASLREFFVDYKEVPQDIPSANDWYGWADGYRKTYYGIFDMNTNTVKVFLKQKKKCHWKQVTILPKGDV